MFLHRHVFIALDGKVLIKAKQIYFNTFIGTLILISSGTHGPAVDYHEVVLKRLHIHVNYICGTLELSRRYVMQCKIIFFITQPKTMFILLNDKKMILHVVKQ